MEKIPIIFPLHFWLSKLFANSRKHVRSRTDPVYHRDSAVPWPAYEDLWRREFDLTLRQASKTFAGPAPPRSSSKAREYVRYPLDS